MRYIISDLHIGHENIIEYCSRPFSTVGEMNYEIKSRWNSQVGDDDTVIILGDFVYPDSVESPANWAEELNGDKLLVRGNHDSGIGQNFPMNVVSSCTLNHGRYEFYCEHRPRNFNGWQLHGHIHNNDTEQYPLINKENKTINVSAELINYKPLRMDTLVSVLDGNVAYSSINND